MSIDERLITRAIVERFTEKLLSSLDLDVAVVGAGPSGLVAAEQVARAGHHVAVFERKLSVGGGMWGGGMMFNEIVVQEQGKRILEEYGIRAKPWKEDYYTADSVETASALCLRAVRSGARVFNLVSVEDVVLREGGVTGLVLNWTPVETAGLPIDPLAVHSRCVIDATGHDAEVVRILEEKAGVECWTPGGGIAGLRSLWAERAEQETVENTREVAPNVFVAGMCANVSFGSHRMGPIFGGMLLSGEKAARLVLERLTGRQEGTHHRS